jgi:hypothetical protein
MEILPIGDGSRSAIADPSPAIFLKLLKDLLTGVNPFVKERTKGKPT